MVGRIILGILGIGLGILISVKQAWLVSTFGHIGVIEKYMRTMGGTRTFYIILGVLLVIISVLYMTGKLDDVVVGIFLKIFRPGGA